MYPVELLPRRRLPVPAVDDRSRFIREISRNPDDFRDEDGQICPEIISEMLLPKVHIELFSLSVSLFGVFCKKHIGIRPTDKSLFDDWNGTEELAPETVDFCVKTSFPVYIHSGLLVKSLILDGFEYSVGFSHKPTRCNYWHYQLYVEKKGDGVIPRKSGAMREKIAKKIAEDIVFNAIDGDLM